MPATNSTIWAPAGTDSMMQAGSVSLDSGTTVGGPESIEIVISLGIAPPPALTQTCTSSPPDADLGTTVMVSEDTELTPELRDEVGRHRL